MGNRGCGNVGCIAGVVLRCSYVCKTLWRWEFAVPVGTCGVGRGEVRANNFRWRIVWTECRVQGPRLTLVFSYSTSTLLATQTVHIYIYIYIYTGKHSLHVLFRF